MNKMTLLTRVLVYFTDNQEFRGKGVSLIKPNFG